MSIALQRAIELLEEAISDERIDSWFIRRRRHEYHLRAEVGLRDWNIMVPRQPGLGLENAARELIEHLGASKMHRSHRG